VNHVVLTGVLVDEPQERCNPEGQAFMALLVGFHAPDAPPDEGWPSACCEVEVPEGTRRRQIGELRPGANVLVTGRLGGGAGGVVATFLSSEAPDGETP
jgi:single-stranded DNA-binding protein